MTPTEYAFQCGYDKTIVSVPWWKWWIIRWFGTKYQYFDIYRLVYVTVYRGFGINVIDKVEGAL